MKKNKVYIIALIGITIFLIFVSIIAILWLQKCIYQETSWNYIKILSFGFVLSGIVGNLIDRLLYMAVTDYLDFNIFGYNFPVFNFADIAIVVGISIIMIDEVRREVYEYRHKTK